MVGAKLWNKQKASENMPVDNNEDNMVNTRPPTKKVIVNRFKVARISSSCGPEYQKSTQMLEIYQESHGQTDQLRTVLDSMKAT
jgi:hypothetical protein